MILKNAKTVWVGDAPWESPDGKVTIWQIKLEVDGERDTHNTMSKALATMGFEGDVEVYTNAKGKDYVRQAPKEDHDKPHYQKSPEQEESIARAVALKAAVELTASDERLMKDKATVLEIADRFLEWLKGGKPSTEPQKAPEEQSTTAVHDFSGDNATKPDKIIADDGEQINLADIPF